jgi:hypothetical protein
MIGHVEHPITQRFFQLDLEMSAAVRSLIVASTGK